MDKINFRDKIFQKDMYNFQLSEFQKLHFVSL